MKDIIEIKPHARPTTREMLNASFVFRRIDKDTYQIIKNRYGYYGLVAKSDFKKAKRQFLAERCNNALTCLYLAVDKGVADSVNDIVKAYIAELRKH